MTMYKNLYTAYEILHDVSDGYKRPFNRIINCDLILENQKSCHILAFIETTMVLL